MIQGHILHRRVVCCPSCRSDRWTPYRRLPAEEGRVINRCSCTRCGGDFEFTEDRAGHPIPTPTPPAAATV
jgi:hypothetical protein